MSKNKRKNNLSHIKNLIKAGIEIKKSQILRKSQSQKNIFFRVIRWTCKNTVKVEKKKFEGTFEK